MDFLKFDDEVYDIVAQIPRGRTATYGQIARLAGFPAHARRVGRALAAAPAEVPCHRVVDAAGRTAPGWTEQRALLEAEGVGFKKNGCVDLDRWGWELLR
ncbi:MAG: methylated-DNA--[protein]-cysteine S-methyltransferase [Alistipes senegalensis]|nr:methylated-DNA--[protein]-cysteine S-methyltransferase [Alistipes senegalensis]